MRNGFLGAIVALAAGAGLALGQSAPGPLQGPATGGPIIAPQLPGGTGLGPIPVDPSGRVGSPPPANWEGFDPNGTPGSQQASAPLFWLNGEYLLWYAKTASTSFPLATQSSILDGGVMGNQTTFPLFGSNSPTKFDGFRVSGGMFFARDVFGVEFSGFSMSRNNSFVEHSAGNPLLAIPYVNSLTGTNTALIVASPTVGAGTVRANSSTNIWGVDGGFVLNLFRSDCDQHVKYSISLYAGARYFSLEEAVNIATEISPPDGTSLTLDNQIFTANTTSTSQVSPAFNDAAGSVVNVNATQITLAQRTIDTFRTSNHFYGGDLGIFQELRFGQFILGLKGRLAIGAMDQTVDIQGRSEMLATNATLFSTRVVGPPDTITLHSLLGTTTNTASGGIFAQQDRIGHYRQTVFAVIPDLNFSLGYQFTPSFSGYVGYNMTWVNRVVRASELVTGASNPNLQPISATFAAASPVPPTFSPFKESTFWVQGVNFGLSIRY